MERQNSLVPLSWSNWRYIVYSKKPVKSRVFRQSSSSIYVKSIAFKSKIKVNLGATVFAA